MPAHARSRLHQVNLDLGRLVLPYQQIVPAYPNLHRPTHRAASDDNTRSTFGEAHIGEPPAHLAPDPDRMYHEMIAGQQHGEAQELCIDW